MLLRIENFHKIYKSGTHALKGVNLQVNESEFLVVIGLSGSGKSTLLRCINRLDRADIRVNFVPRKEYHTREGRRTPKRQETHRDGVPAIQFDQEAIRDFKCDKRKTRISRHIRIHFRELFGRCHG